MDSVIGDRYCLAFVFDYSKAFKQTIAYQGCRDPTASRLLTLVVCRTYHAACKCRLWHTTDRNIDFQSNPKKAFCRIFFLVQLPHERVFLDHLSRVDPPMCGLMRLPTSPLLRPVSERIALRDRCSLTVTNIEA